MLAGCSLCLEEGHSRYACADLFLNSWLKYAPYLVNDHFVVVPHSLAPVETSILRQVDGWSKCGIFLV